MTFSDLTTQADTDGVIGAEHYPFLLRSSAKHAVLLVHGFTASPLEMRPLAEILHRGGTTCLGVRLPGHGTSPSDLATRRWEEWLEAVEHGFLLLKKEYQSIYAVGMSTGCLLLLALALQHRLAGLVLCSPYLRVLHPLARYAGLLRHVRRFHPSPAGEAGEAGTYASRPVYGVHQINRLTRHLSGHLDKITPPTLAINAEGDQTVDIHSGRRLYDKLGSRVKIYFRFGPETPHVMTGESSPQREVAFCMIHDFIRELREAT